MLRSARAPRALVQHSTAQHSTAQHSTAQHSTAAQQHSSTADFSDSLVSAVYFEIFLNDLLLRPRLSSPFPSTSAATHPQPSTGAEFKCLTLTPWAHTGHGSGAAVYGAPLPTGRQPGSGPERAAIAHRQPTTTASSSGFVPISDPHGAQCQPVGSQPAGGAGGIASGSTASIRPPLFTRAPTHPLPAITLTTTEFNGCVADGLTGLQHSLILISFSLSSPS